MENNTNKTNNKKFLIMAIVAVILIVTGIVLAFTMKKEEKPQTEKTEQKEELTPQEQVETIDGIEKIAIEIYKSGNYTHYGQTSRGYYITYAELKQLGYNNIDTLVQGPCRDDQRIIYINSNNPNPDQEYPVGIVYDCQSVEQ